MGRRREDGEAGEDMIVSFELNLPTYSHGHLHTQYIHTTRRILIHITALFDDGMVPLLILPLEVSSLALND